VKLGNVAEFINRYPFKPTDWSTSGREIIRIQNLTKGSSELNKLFLEKPKSQQIKSLIEKNKSVRDMTGRLNVSSHTVIKVKKLLV
jgi:hypothetical protein